MSEAICSVRSCQQSYHNCEYLHTRDREAHNSRVTRLQIEAPFPSFPQTLAGMRLLYWKIQLAELPFFRRDETPLST